MIKQSSQKNEKEINNKIEALEESNKSLKKRLDSYKEVKSDWINFKRELSHDLDKLGTALKDFAIPSK
jgi:archaellum component FlaC